MIVMTVLALVRAHLHPNPFAHGKCTTHAAMTACRGCGAIDEEYRAKIGETRENEYQCAQANGGAAATLPDGGPSFLASCVARQLSALCALDANAFSGPTSGPT
jgi:hypothetical protein